MYRLIPSKIKEVPVFSDIRLRTLGHIQRYRTEYFKNSYFVELRFILAITVKHLLAAT